MPSKQTPATPSDEPSPMPAIVTALEDIRPRTRTARSEAPDDSDFASGAMLRLISHGLRRQGILLPGLHAEHRTTVGLDEKRELLTCLHARHGALPLLRTGEGIADAPDEPALVALMAAHDPRDLLQRWQRLEAYVHSRHHIEVRFDDAAGTAVVIQHVSRQAEQPPSLGEDLLVYGLLTALMEAVLKTHVEVRHLESQHVARRDGEWHAPLPGSWQCGVRLTWSPRHPQPTPRIRAAERMRDAVRALVLADAARNWTLQSACEALELAPRTLQRRLGEEGCQFAAVVLDARATHAARLLAHSGESLSTIGFISGYADQSHFTRDFKRRTAMTPASYRSAFATPRRSSPSVVAGTAG